METPDEIMSDSEYVLYSQSEAREAEIRSGMEMMREELKDMRSRCRSGQGDSLLHMTRDSDKARMRREDEAMMRRALQLARAGEGFTSPNPMVGAVVTARGRIIGEGWHRLYGAPHAEVNAIRSVAGSDRPLLKEATIYVTLEPCSHYGKTPPCARLIIDTGIPRVVTGAGDPNPLVAGRGIRMLREAGCEVTEGVLADECRELNRRFMTAQTLRRPYIQLKWAQSADGFMAGTDSNGAHFPLHLSNGMSLRAMHRQRALADAIMAGTDTVVIDNPRLSVRHFPGRDPLRVTFDSPRIPPGANILRSPHVLLDSATPLEENMRLLFGRHNVSSLMVEGGARLLQSFIDAGLYDEIRLETSTLTAGAGLPSPTFRRDGLRLTATESYGGNRVETFRR